MDKITELENRKKPMAKEIKMMVNISNCTLFLRNATKQKLFLHFQ